MEQLRWKYTKTDRSESIFLSATAPVNFIRTVASTNPRFEALRDYLFGEELPELEVVRRMVDAGPETIKGITKLSERVSLKNGVLYFDGDMLDNALSNHIARMVTAGDDNYHAFILFLENLATNPSRRARRELFAWLNDRNFTITKDGMFIAYKGVQNVPDNLSITRGNEPIMVNGVEHTGYIPNPLGATVEMPRSLVNDNKSVHCSVGLHAGTQRYATNFGQKLLLVVINPRDVVSVPNDSNSEKLRVCRYVVAEEGKDALVTTTYEGAHFWVAPAPDDEVEEESQDEPTKPDVPAYKGNRYMVARADGKWAIFDRQKKEYVGFALSTRELARQEARTLNAKGSESDSAAQTEDAEGEDTEEVLDKPEDAFKCNNCSQFLPEGYGEDDLCDDCFRDFMYYDDEDD
jgi:hypothetical protein